MRGTCDFCDQPATHRCQATNCTKQMCDAHTSRERDTATQRLGTRDDPYLVFYAYCPHHADPLPKQLR